jgi:hypothetical protein
MPPLLAAAVLAAFAALAPTAAAGREVPARWGPYALELLDARGRPLPTFVHRGRTYVLGTLGERYLLRVRNDGGRRIEVVASVDGRDVVDGRPAAFERRGYVVAPGGEVTIDGFRLSEAAVAAFRFSTVPRSYAARKGDARDVGVVGVAIFPERWPAYAAPPPPYPRPLPDPSDERAGSRAEQETSPQGRAEAQRGAAPPSASEGPLADGSPRAKPGLAPPSRRPGLGTEFGEERASYVEQVSFVREASRPEAVPTLRYDDRAGLAALGIDVDGARFSRRDERWLRETASPFRAEAGYCEPPPGWAR